MKPIYKYDVFISHVFEDKEAIADLVNEALVASGFRVWYSGTSLRIGDKIDEEIPEIINQCKYAVVIVSPDYLKSKWAFKELTLLVSAEKVRLKKLLPIWHSITKKQVLQEWPQLADRLALSSAKGLDVIIPKIISELKKRGPYARRSATGGKDPDKSGEQEMLNNSGMFIKGTTININSQNVTGRDSFTGKHK